MAARLVMPDTHGHGTLMLSGDIDLAAVDEIGEAIRVLQELTPSSVTVDLSAVAFLDSSGVRELIRANQAFAGPVSITGVTPAIERVLELTGLLSLVSILPDPGEPDVEVPRLAAT